MFSLLANLIALPLGLVFFLIWLTSLFVGVLISFNLSLKPDWYFYNVWCLLTQGIVIETILTSFIC